METVGTVMLEENTSEERFISDEKLLQLLYHATREDRAVGVHLMFMKYPQLWDYAESYGDNRIVGHMIVPESACAKFIRNYPGGSWSTPEFISKALGLEKNE